MCALIPDHLVGQLLHIIDLSDRGDRVGAVMGTDNERLRLVIRNAADPHIPGHLIQILFKFGPKRRTFDIVNGAVKAAVSVDHQTSSSGSEVGMIVCSEE